MEKLRGKRKTRLDVAIKQLDFSRNAISCCHNFFYFHPFLRIVSPTRNGLLKSLYSGSWANPSKYEVVDEVDYDMAIIQKSRAMSLVRECTPLGAYLMSVNGFKRV
jgi:hypothetical protein